GREIERGQNAADPEREDAAAGNGRRGLRAGAVRPCGRIDAVWRGVRRAPDLLARRHIERADNLLLALTGDHYDPIAEYHWGCMPGADRNLPAFLQRCRPLGGQGGENGTIARRAAPLWPVGAGLGAGWRQRDHQPTNNQQAATNEGSSVHLFSNFAWGLTPAPCLTDAHRSRYAVFVLLGAGAPPPRSVFGRSPLALRARVRDLTSAAARSSARHLDPADPERHGAPFPGRRAQTRRKARGDPGTGSVTGP